MKNILLSIIILGLLSCSKDAGRAEFSSVGNTGQGGSMARFTIAGNYLYTVDKQDLKVFDITNPAQPVYKRTVPVGFEIETIFPFGGKLFIGSTTMVHIFSITDPSNPQKLSEAISPTVMRRCDPVVAKDNVAYATLRTNGPCGGIQSVMAVYNITDVLHPVQVNAINVSEPYGLGYSGNTLYVCDRFMGLLVFDITQPYQPVHVKSLPVQGSFLIDVIPYNDVLVCWAENGMLLYDITNKQNPVLVKEIH